MLALVLQGVFSLIASGVMLLLLQPEWYLIIGVLTAIVAGGLIIYAQVVVEDDPSFWWLATTILVVLFIGLFWPIVPCATAYGALVDRDEHPRAPFRGR